MLSTLLVLCLHNLIPHSLLFVLIFIFLQKGLHVVMYQRTVVFCFFLVKLNENAFDKNQVFSVSLSKFIY